MIGLVGAHRVGKTTLAREFAKEQRIAFLQTNTSAIFKAVGMDPKVDYPLSTRIALQHVILEGLVKQYEMAAQKARLWITDRTPLDTAAYMLADVTRENCAGEGLSDTVVSYVEECIKVTNRFFGVLVLVQPGIEPVEEEGKAPAVPAYQEHFNHLAFGLLMDERLNQRHFFIKRHITDLEERKASLFNAVSASVDSWKQTLAASPLVAH